MDPRQDATLHSKPGEAGMIQLDASEKNVCRLGLTVHQSESHHSTSQLVVSCDRCIALCASVGLWVHVVVCGCSCMCFCVGLLVCECVCLYLWQSPCGSAQKRNWHCKGDLFWSTLDQAEYSWTARMQKAFPCMCKICTFLLQGCQIILRMFRS